MIASVLRPWFLVLACVSAAGCAQTATIRRLQPAQLNLSSQRLGMVNVPGARQESAQALEVLRSRLADAGVSVVDQYELQQASPVPIVFANGTANLPAAVEAARRMGLDSLLITRVSFVEPDGSVYGSKLVRFGDPKVTAAVRYELVDVRSGDVFDRDTVKADYCQDEMTSKSEPKILSKLAQESGLKLAKIFTPHETLVEVRLAHATLGPGATDVRKGSQAAKEGDWNRALLYWNAAVQAGEKNDAALYNLGLAHEALGDPTQARHWIASALAVNPSDTYREALARVEQSEVDLRVARLQTLAISSVPRSSDQQWSDQPPAHLTFTRLPALSRLPSCE